MAREVAEATESTKPKAEQRQGVTFVKNHLNELVRLPDGTEFRFEKVRQTFTDEAQIEAIRSVAKKFNIHES